MKQILFFFCMVIQMVFFSCNKENDSFIESPFFDIKLEGDVCNVPVKGLVKEFSVETNLPELKVTPLVSEGYTWCSLISRRDESDKVISLELNVAENGDVDKREAAFVIGGQGVENDTLRIVQLGTDPLVLTDVASKSFSAGEQEFVLKVTANVPYEVSNLSSWFLLQSNADTRGLVESTYVYKVAANSTLSPRTDTIYVRGKEVGDTILVKIPVEQAAAELEEMLPDDIKHSVASVVQVQGEYHSGNAAENTIDNNYDTYFITQSHKSGTVIFEYTMAPDVQRVDYVLLHAKKGAAPTTKLCKGRLYYKSDIVKDWTFCASFDTTEIVPMIRLDVNLVKPTHFKLELERNTVTYRNVALAEFECYEKIERADYDLDADKIIFEDDVFSVLRSGVTAEDIQKITHPVVRSVAQELLAGTYSKEFRSRTYHSIKNPSTVGSELTIGKRSICDNPTGIFFQKNRKYIIFVGKSLGNNKLNLHIRDWREGGGNITYTLLPGLNEINNTMEGNGYIQYWTPTDEPFPDVNIHVCYGDEIGFWDVRAGHTNADWKRILTTANATVQRLDITNAMMDMLGEYVQMCNTVNAFNTYCPQDIESVVALHDELMRIEYAMMGLFKYNAVPRNRMLGVRSWGGNPNWNGTNANFPNREKEWFDKAAFLNKIWVFGHEFGHGNQVAQMKIPGWNEVSNNIFAYQVQCIMAGKMDRFSYDKYLREVVVTGDEYFAHGDPWIMLAPLGQLSLFFTLTDTSVPWHKPDFWADVHWAAIQDKTTGNNYGLSYVNFMRRCMDASGYDLRDFFRKMGMLREVNRKLWSYGGDKQVKITKEMVEELEKYGATKAPLPGRAVIYYIADSNLALFNARQPIQGSLGQGLTDDGTFKIVSHAVWKNVVAYETYAGDRLVEVVVSGKDLSENGSTKIPYPSGSTRIEAVAWNGDRTLVYGKR